MKTITLWNVPVERAKKIIDLMKEEAQDALKNEDFERVSDLMYDINRINRDIEFADEA